MALAPKYVSYPNKKSGVTQLAIRSHALHHQLQPDAELPVHAQAVEVEVPVRGAR